MLPLLWKVCSQFYSLGYRKNNKIKKTNNRFYKTIKILQIILFSENYKSMPKNNSKGFYEHYIKKSDPYHFFSAFSINHLKTKNVPNLIK